jgi:hypothetical protein
VRHEKLGEKKKKNTGWPLSWSHVVAKMRAWWTQLAKKKNQQGHKQAVKRLNCFFPFGGREAGRVKIEVVMKAVGGGEASEHLWRGWAVLSPFWRLAPMRYSRIQLLQTPFLAWDICSLVSSVQDAALPCPALHCTALVSFLCCKKCSQQPIVGCHRLHTSTSSALHRESFLQKLRFLF